MRSEKLDEDDLATKVEGRNKSIVAAGKRLSASWTLARVGPARVKKI
jgi:hypothetical protein